MYGKVEYIKPVRGDNKGVVVTMRIPKKLLMGVAGLLVAAGAFVAILNVTGASTEALTMGDRRDCGYTDVIVNCGTTSTAELLDVYDKNDDRRGNRDIQAIFNHYGITRTDITGTTSTVKKGWLNTNGTIVVDGKTVADGAKSLYRAHPGKEVSPVTIAGKTFYIGPVAGNYGLGADLFVFFNKDGTFRAAIQASCGNPIVANNKVTPPPTPVYTCDSLVAKKIDRTKFDFTSSATVKHDAQIVSYTYNFGDGTSATTGRTVRHEYKNAGTYTVTVTVNFKVNGKAVSKTGVNCKTTVTVAPAPSYACTSLTAKKVNRTTYDFTVKASAANGAKIVSYNYNFGNGKTAKTTSTTVRHDYGNNPKTYTATVTVNVLVNGKTVVTPVGNCKANVVVEPQVFKCENLAVTKLSRTQFKFVATASATNATIKSYTFNFGDGTSKGVTTSAKTASTTHTYSDKAASYTASVIVTMSDGKIAPTSQNCKVVLKVEEKQVPSISIEKTVNGKEHIKTSVGTEFTYEITVRNTGNVVLKDAVVTDNAPSEVTLLSASAGTIEGNKWTYTIPELKAGESKSFTIKAKYPKYVEGVHKNKVCVDTPTVPGSPDDCDDATTETDEPIEVCDLTDNTIKTIERSEFNKETMTTDLSQCDDMKVCIIEDKTIKTIKKNEFDESTMTTDLSKCEEVETPPELPKTGLEMFISGSLGLGSITAAGYYWSASRKNLLDALLKK